MRKDPTALVTACGLVLVLMSAGVPVLAGISLSLQPSPAGVEVGDTLVVELCIDEAGSTFNAYDAIVGFDKRVVTFLQASPVSWQEGALMTDACYNRWHQFSIAPDSSCVEINHSLLCSGVSVTGPGVVYRLQFICGPFNVDTGIALLDGTVFYDNGLFVLPLETQDLQLRIGHGTPVPPAPNAPRLRAAPNPFNPRTEFFFEPAEAGHVELSICTLDGRRVRRLLAGPLDAKPQRCAWDGRDDGGRRLASGCYLAVLETARGRDSRRITLVK